LRVATANMKPPVRLFALNWSLDKPYSTIHRICGDRVFQRGDKHQTLHADTVAKSHEEVIWTFITGTEELADSEVDASVDMDFEDTSEQALERAIDACVEVLGVAKPSAEKVKEALAYVQEYSPKVKKPSEKKAQKTAALRYFGLLPEVDLTEVVGNRLEGAADVQAASQTFWQNLKAKGRVTRRPHVTIVHSNSLHEEAELWDRCQVLHRLANPPLFRFNLGAVIWNDRIMAVTVDNVELELEESQGQEGHEFVSKLSHEIRERLHITVATRDAKVPAVEAKALVEKWRAGEKIEDVNVAPLEGLVVKGRVKGMS
jgi:tRNA ligase